MSARHSWPMLLLLAAFALLSARLFWLIDANAVNVLYWDQWDFYEALFDDASLWETFRWQHGPHRQGLGFLLTRGVANLTAWDTRAEALTNGIVVWSACVLFLWLRVRLLGRLDLAAVAIPLLVLTPAQYGVFLHTPNASHGTLPLLLVALYGLALTIHATAPRLACLLALNYLLIHTGFGLFAGLITPCLFAVDCVLRHEERTIHLVALGLALLSGVSFFVGYTWDPATTGGSGRAIYIPRFMGLMLSNLWGVKGTGFLPTLLGIATGIGAIWIAAQRTRAILRGADAPIDRVITFLVAFSLLFCLGTAIGRVGMGFSMAQSSRYVPLCVPLLVGIVLHCMSLSPRGLRVGLESAAVVALVAATFPMRVSEARFMQKLATGKRVWVEIYQASHDIPAADQAAGLKIYPWPPETTRLQWKLDRLEADRLNLFKQRGASAEPLR